MAIPKFSMDLTEGQFSTSNVALAGILSALGFEFRGVDPVLLIISANSLIDLIDLRTGTMSDCMRWSAHFMDRTRHHRFGVIKAGQIAAIHEARFIRQSDDLAKLGKSHEAILPSRRVASAKRMEAWAPPAQLIDAVEIAGDTVENVLLIAGHVQELSGNPLIQASRGLKIGMLDLLRPAEHVDEGNRMIEKFIKKL